MPSIEDVYNVFQNEECFRYTKLAGRYGIANYMGQVDQLQEDTKRYGERFPYRKARLAELRQMTNDIIQMMVDHHETEAVAVLEQSLGIHLKPSRKPAKREWTLRHMDSFAHEPASVEAHGTDLLSGLIQLWRHVLRESIFDTGETKFSNFKLIWTDGKTEDEIEIMLESQKNLTLAKIRRWVYPPTEEDKKLPVDKWKYGMDGRLEDYPLLRSLAIIHLLLILPGRLIRIGYIDSRRESVVAIGLVKPMFSSIQLRIFGIFAPFQIR